MRSNFAKVSRALILAGALAKGFATNLKMSEAQTKMVMQELWKLYVQRSKLQNSPTTDLARTMTYCIAVNYVFFNGYKDISLTQTEELRKDLRAALAEDPKLRKMSNADKQRMNEGRVMLTHFAILGQTISQKAPPEQRDEVLAGFRKMAGMNLRGILGVDPKRVAFNNDGLVIKPA